MITTTVARVVSLTTRTVAPGTGPPDASRTTPAITPPGDWARAAIGAANNAAIAAASKRVHKVDIHRLRRCRTHRTRAACTHAGRSYLPNEQIAGD